MGQHRSCRDCVLGCVRDRLRAVIKCMGSLIEAVNVLGSLLYGGMLGVFVLAFFFPRVTARGALYGVLVAQVIIFARRKYTGLAFLGTTSWVAWWSCSRRLRCRR